MTKKRLIKSKKLVGIPAKPKKKSYKRDMKKYLNENERSGRLHSKVTPQILSAKYGLSLVEAENALFDFLRKKDYAQVDTWRMDGKLYVDKCPKCGGDLYTTRDYHDLYCEEHGFMDVIECGVVPTDLSQIGKPKKPVKITIENRVSRKDVVRNTIIAKIGAEQAQKGLSLAKIEEAKIVIYTDNDKVRFRVESKGGDFGEVTMWMNTVGFRQVGDNDFELEVD